MAIRVGINGYGRIGRLTHRALLAFYGAQAEVVAVNGTTDAETAAYLFQYDSNYGRFFGEVKAEGNVMVVNGREVRVLRELAPSNLPWGELGVEVVVEATGKFRKAGEAAAHLIRGAEKVIITAPAEGVDLTLVLGVNEHQYDFRRHHLISAASCTTVCLAPVCKVLQESFGIERGMVTTIHSYTNDQRMVDSSHKDVRRGRAGALNIVPTTTGAAKAIGDVIPELKGKLEGIAFRVPTPTVSVLDLNVVLEEPAATGDLHAVFCEAAQGKLKGILRFTTDPVVSTDIKGDSASGIVDGDPRLTFAGPSRMAKVVAWYDNEWGYACRVAELVLMVKGRGRLASPPLSQPAFVSSK